jgi:TonB family protein
MLALIVAAALAQAAPEAAPPTPSVMTQPDWLRRPTGEDMARYFPDRAMRSGQAGRATIFCRVTADGTLADCHVTEESPLDYGFGDAALKLGSLFRMRPMTKDGKPVEGGMINIPIRFLLPGAPLDMMSAELSCYGQAAALADKEPNSVEAWTAVTFFSAQVAVQFAQSKSTPKVFEESLQGAHRAAVMRPPSPNYDVSLRKCLDFAMKNMKPVTLPK